MYSVANYIKRGLLFANNTFRPGHKKISTLMLYSTNACNSACRHCLVWRKRPFEHMPLSKIVEIMGSRCVTRDTVVGLEGGEFIMHPEAEAIMRWFSENHPKFDLLTNGLLPDRVIELVKKYPPQRLYVSLDGDRETYHAMRGKDGYDKVIRVLDECKDFVPISVMFTLTPFNSFKNLDFVVNLCLERGIDIRIGIYNEIYYFDTTYKAHQPDFFTPEAKDSAGDQSPDGPGGNHADFKKSIPQSVKRTQENYDFLYMYDDWKKGHTKLKCMSITDSLVIHANGDVPICQSKELFLGNVYESDLDTIFNSKATQKLHKEHINSCNGCWINFHRKYDIVLLRSLEKVLPKWAIEMFYGKYQWGEDPRMKYSRYVKQG